MVDTIINVAILGGVGYLAYEYYKLDGDLCKNSIIGLAPVCSLGGAISFFKKTQDIGVGVPIGLEGCREGWHNDGLTCREPISCCGDKDLFGNCYAWNLCGGHVEGRLNHGGTCRPDHPDRIDSLCYQSCPTGWVHVGGMPYLCRDGRGGNFWDATGGAYLNNLGSWFS
jgi:hypothetical protein